MSQNQKRKFTTRTLVCMALLAALSVVLARLLIPMPAADTRFSIERVPIVISGILFGPFAGALVGFVADAVGTLFSGYGYNPMFSIPPIMYGLIAGLLRSIVAREERPNFVKILIMFLIPAILGSILWQSFPLSLFYGAMSGKGYFAYVIARTPQFAVTAVVEALITWALFKSGLFARIRLWPNRDLIERLDARS